MNRGRALRLRSGPAAAAYFALTLVMTWPLVLGLGSDVPGDLGDSLLNMWILAWGADHIPKLLVGAISWADFWNANIFHPEPLALTFSEHLFGQSLQILPIYWLTGNIILCYNLVFLSTFVVSAYGTYLLVRDLTGNQWAAFLAGLIYGFSPYRFAAMPHVQVMSSQWMPLALYGLNRSITNWGAEGITTWQRYRPLVGGTAALVMQNWSCGYYLLYFAPFAPLFVIFRMWTNRRLADLRLWISLAAAATVTLALTLPFLFPYLDAQQRFGFERPFGEVTFFSANVLSYVTAASWIRVWGTALRYYPHGEAETFLGFAPWVVAIVGLFMSGPYFLKASPPHSRWRKVATVILVLAVISQVIAILSTVTLGGIETSFFGLAIRAKTPARLLEQLGLSAILLFAVSPESRQIGARLVRSPLVFFLAATLVAMWLSLGPEPRSGDVYLSGFGLYDVLYEHVPGFRGVRVPARYAMIAALFLAGAAGCAAAAIWQRNRRLAYGVIAVAGVCALVDSASMPLERNHAWVEHEAMPPSTMLPASQAPAIYQRVKALPAGSAITEFPFGDAGWEIRYVYYSAAHWKPITNGYSGSFPTAYKTRQARFMDVTKDPEASWTSLIDSKSTHAVVHVNAFKDPAHAAAVKSWLESHGARAIETTADGDILYILSGG